MAGSLAEFAELARCSLCQQPFNEAEAAPKVLACKHHFCLACCGSVLLKDGVLYCAHCWKRTDASPGGLAALPTHAAALALATRLARAPVSPCACSGSVPSAPLAPAAPLAASVSSSACAVHNMPHSLWCMGCCEPLCRACAAQDHLAHPVKPQADARHLMRQDFHRELQDMQKTLQEIQRLASRQREFLLGVLEACTTLKTQVETDLVNNAPGYEVSEARDCLQKAHRTYAATENGGPRELRSSLLRLTEDRERLAAKHRDMFLQCKLDDLIRNSSVVFDFELLKRALAGLHSGETSAQPDAGFRNPVLFLANYCMSQLYSRHCLFKQQQRQQNGGIDYRPLTMPDANPLDSRPDPASPDRKSDIGFPDTVSQPAPSPLLRNPSQPKYPLYYFNIEVDGAPYGRILIEVRSDVAPKMAKNFGVLTTGELGIGYKGCSIFQCWENESIITGDFELNNGRGGRSVFEESYFMPDDTKIVAGRGSVGMRRSQKRHDNLGLVGSQFRIVLREMRGFTGIFAFVVEGLELIDRISRLGDSAGKPQSTVLIAGCGKYN